MAVVQDYRLGFMKAIPTLAITAVALLTACANPVDSGIGTPSAKFRSGEDTSEAAVRECERQ